MVSLNKFIDEWAKIYYYKNEEWYSIIEKPLLLPDDIEVLYNWKNGFEIKNNKTKRRTINDLKSKTADINKLRRLNPPIHQLDDFKQFDDISTIWKTFLLHIIDREYYPIFDQHVYRSYRYLSNLHQSELPAYHKESFKIYTNIYMPFFNSVVEKSNKKKRDVDKALWAFGKFLKSDYKNITPPLGGGWEG